MAARKRGLFSLYIYIENFKKSSCQNLPERFWYNLAELFLWWPSIKIVQTVMICQKTWPPGDGAYFPLVFIENFKNLLVRNHWADVNKILQKCLFGDPLPRLLKSSWLDKTWPPGAWLLAHLSYAQDELLWSLFVGRPSVHASVP